MIFAFVPGDTIPEKRISACFFILCTFSPDMEGSPAFSLSPAVSKKFSIFSGCPDRLFHALCAEKYKNLLIAVFIQLGILKKSIRLNNCKNYANGKY